MTLAKSSDPGHPPRTEPVNSLEKLLDFLNQLDDREISHRLSRARPEAIMVEIAVPGERWEVEFFADGRAEVEVFRSPGIIGDGGALLRLFEEFSDGEVGRERPRRETS